MIKPGICYPAAVLRLLAARGPQAREAIAAELASRLEASGLTRAYVRARVFLCLGPKQLLRRDRLVNVTADGRLEITKKGRRKLRRWWDVPMPRVPAVLVTPPRWLLALPRLIARTVALAALVLLVSFEVSTSRFSAFSYAFVAKRLTYGMEHGASPTIRYPVGGPLDERRGYVRLPSVLRRLDARGYGITAQARLSPAHVWMTEKGLPTIYRVKQQAGLTLLDERGRIFHYAAGNDRKYQAFEQIPPLVVETLAFIENREVLDVSSPFRNPAVELDRLGKAVLDLGLSSMSNGRRPSGGSTLATQIEKYRHSPGGRTSGVSAKLKQMTAATLRSYMDGEETLEARRRIVLDYVNSFPLASRPGVGEIEGLGMGLEAWFGADFREVNQMLAEGDRQGDAPDMRFAARALAYKRVLSLFLALRRPAHYLVEEPAALARLTTSYLDLLASQGVISSELRDASHTADLAFVPSRGNGPATDFVEKKAASSVRIELADLLGVRNLYDLDRMDMTAVSTLDVDVQSAVTQALRRLQDGAFVSEAGLTGERLLDGTNPTGIVYSLTLMERKGDANLVRIKTDTLQGPFDLNHGAKMELGSTAKLRTLITYLEIVAGLHAAHAGKSTEELAAMTPADDDVLTRWAVDWLKATPSDRSLDAMLEAAMDRRYSASSGERFFTGGGVHHFANFDGRDEGAILTVREAFRRSVNLPFIRIMRDVVGHYRARIVVGDKERQAYLERFADQESKSFLRRFYRRYAGVSVDERLRLLVDAAPFWKRTSKRLAALYRSAEPEGDVEAMTAFVRAHLPGMAMTPKTAQKLFADLAPDRLSLVDRAYLAGVHPLELWLVALLRKEPEATLEHATLASAEARRSAYDWLMESKSKAAQDQRIATMVEAEAFVDVHRAWKRLGYPFGRLVPSLATAIGSSGDRPSALAELMGILVGDGMRYPTVGVVEVAFAEGTPYETAVARRPTTPERVLAPEIARVVRDALLDVVENGTARRVAGAFKHEDGTTLPLRGKTGTGDNRRQITDRSGRVVESRGMNRTATFVFAVGDRFFGTLVAFAPDASEGRYRFTSALPAGILKVLAPDLMPLVDRPEEK